MAKIQRRKRILWISYSLTAIIWLFAGPWNIPGISLIPVIWRIYGATLFFVIQLLGPGRDFIPGLIKNPKNPRTLPLLLSSWATLLCIASSVIIFFKQTSLNETLGASLHIHSASFIISFYLSLVLFLDLSERANRLQALRELNLTSVMATKLKEAETSIPTFVNRSLHRLPVIYGSIAILTLLSLIGWFFYTGNIEQGLVQVAAVLAVCSPWMWLSVIPDGFRMAVRTAANKKALLSNAASIEIATQINAIIFGKRGTITEGSPRVTDLIPTMNIDEEELLLWCASAEHGSRHPFGQAIVDEAKAQSIPLEPPERFVEMSGRGVECVIDGQTVRLGKPAFFNKASVPAYLADRLEVLAQEGKTSFICCRNTEYLGIIAVTEKVRNEAAAAIESIRRLGLRTIMMTGDDRMMSETLAERLHIDQVIAEVLAEDKPKEINKLRREGFRIGMIGNVPEDNESFTESELGITLNRGKGRELPLTDIIMLRDNLQHVVSFLDISSQTMRITRENNLFAYIYHGAAALLAAGCLVPFGYAPLTPVLGTVISGAALLMVTLNMRRIRGNP